MSDDYVDTSTLQLRVVELRKKLRLVVAQKLVEIEKQKVYNLEATKFATEFDAMDVPTIQDPFDEPPEQKEDDGKLLEDLKNQMLILTILNRKKSCPISQVIDCL